MKYKIYQSDVNVAMSHNHIYVILAMKPVYRFGVDCLSKLGEVINNCR
ncbi:hypothetical protein RINTHH_7850 [Richelia intracellularis HH01]|uniref:Uncharacterized protein n=1 Tax=Richelia intracellularis HH01 TaxID=1165094 RepID=M1X2J6_9NOST|nr:hypothetical protein RINTHH_7850 [Richelia intracellularis HH01]